MFLLKSEASLRTCLPLTHSVSGLRILIWLNKNKSTLYKRTFLILLVHLLSFILNEAFFYWIIVVLHEFLFFCLSVFMYDYLFFWISFLPVKAFFQYKQQKYSHEHFRLYFTRYIIFLAESFFISRREAPLWAFLSLTHSFTQSGV